MMPTLVMAGSARTQATSLCFNAASRLFRSLNSTTRVDFAGDANGEAIGVRGGERELPVRQTEAALQFFADPHGIFCGQHECQTLAEAIGDCVHYGFGGMTSHCAGVAETEVDVVVAVYVGEMRTAGVSDEDGEFASPFF